MRPHFPDSSRRSQEPAKNVFVRHNVLTVFCSFWGPRLHFQLVCLFFFVPVGFDVPTCKYSTALKRRGNTDMCLLRYAALGERKKLQRLRWIIIHKRLVVSPLLCCHFGSSRDDTGGVHLTCALWRRTLWASSANFYRAAINRNHRHKLLITVYGQFTDTAQLAPLSQASANHSAWTISLRTVK